MQPNSPFSLRDLFVLCVACLAFASLVITGCGGGDGGSVSGDPIKITPSQILDGIGAPFGAGRTARRMQNTTQLRGIQQAMVLYSNSNNSFYPGISPDGRVITDLAKAGFGNPPYKTAVPSVTDISIVYAALLNGEFFTPEYIISPVEVPGAKVQAASGSTVTNKNYSYAMLNFAKGSERIPRQNEWKDTNNSMAPVVADRSKAIDSSLATTSVHVTATSTASTDWNGSIAWNDNHVTFETSGIRATGTVKIGSARNDAADDLFRADEISSMGNDGDVLFSFGE